MAKESIAETIHVVVTSKRRKVGALLDSIAHWVLLLTVFLVPFFGFPMPGLALSFSKLALFSTGIVLSLLLYLVARLEDGKIIIPKHLLLGALGLIALVFLAAGLRSDAVRLSLLGYGNESGTFAIIFLSCLGAFLLSVYFREFKRLVTLFSALLLSFLLVFILQLVHLFGLDIAFLGLAGGKAVSVLGKWNDLGLFAGMFAVLGIVGYEFFPARSRLRLFAVLATVLALLELVLVNFTVAWTMVGIFALIVVIYLFTVGGTSRRILSPAFIVLVLSIVFLIASSSVGGVLDRFGINTLEVRPAWSATYAVARESLPASPLLGVGPNRFVNAWLLHKPSGVNDTVFWNADFTSGVATLPTHVVTTGLLGLIAWLIFIVLFLISGYRALLADVGVGERGVLLTTYVLALYLWLVQLIYVPDPVLTVFAFLMTGIFVAAMTATGVTKTTELSFQNNPRLGFLVVVVLVFLMIVDVAGAYALGTQYRSFALFRDGAIAFNQEGNLDKAAELLVGAVKMSEQDLYYRSLAEVHISRMGRIANTKDVAPDTLRSQFQVTLGAAIASAGRAVALDSHNYANSLTLAHVYTAIVPLNIQGAYEAAVTAYDNAKKVNPSSPAIPLERARLDLAKNDRKAARAHIDEALALKANYTDALFLLSQIEADEGNVKKAIANAEQASLISPNDVGVFFQLGLLRYINNDLAGAATALERAVALNPQFANAKYFLGLAYGRSGRIADATKQFEEIEVSNPDNPEVKKILSNLRLGLSPLTGIVPSPTARPEPPIKESKKKKNAATE